MDIHAAAEKLASDPGFTDYDFWRTLKNLDYEIFQRAASNQPIPIDMLRWRRISSAPAPGESDGRANRQPPQPASAARPASTG